MDVSLVLRALFWFNVAITLAISKGESSINEENQPIFADRLIENELDVNRTLAANRIVAGTPVAKGTIPGLGLIASLSVGRVSIGTLITPNYVLTTASDLCSNMREFVPSLRVFFNAVNVNPIDSDAISRGVTELKIHPRYLPSSPKKLEKNNVALLKLDAPVLTIPTIRLASVANLFANQPATIYGFGVNRILDGTPATPSDTLLQGSLTVLSPEQCTVRFGSRVSSQHLCAVGPQAPCWGDQGSPLMVDQLQVAITSSYQNNCNPSSSAVLTRVHYFYEWIKSNTDLF